ncbi:unnamed protein product, partial [marine sediment metagenome]
TELCITFKEFPPQHPSWHGTSTEGGFKWRNLEMVRWGDQGIRIRSKRTKSYGSGFTIDRMESRGKPIERYEVD